MEAVPLLPMSTSRTHGERMSESSIEGSSSSCSKKFFMPGDAFAQLRNLSSHMAFAAASKTLGGTPDTFETEADWDTSNDEPATTSCQLQAEYSKFCRFGFGTSPWFDGHWSTAAC